MNRDEGGLGCCIICVCIDGVGNVNSAVYFEGINGVSIQQIRACHRGHDHMVLISFKFATFFCTSIRPLKLLESSRRFLLIC